MTKGTPKNRNLAKPARAGEAKAAPVGQEEARGGENAAQTRAERGEKLRNLLKQEGMTLDQWRKLADEEVNDERVLKALDARGAALAELGRSIAVSELEFTVEAFGARRREIAARWNAAVSFAKTIYRHCEWCARRVLFRHRLSRFCCDKCSRAAKEDERRQRRKERRALGQK